MPDVVSERGCEKTRTRIGFLVDVLDINFQSKVLEGISRACIKEEIDLLVFSGASQVLESGRHNEYKVVRDFIFRQDIDGLVILSGAISEYYPVDEIKKIVNSFQPLPMVSIALKIPGIPSVLTDNTGGIKNVLYHLIDHHKYRKIAFLKGPADHDEANLRFDAYKEVLKQKDIKYNPLYVIEGSNFSEEAGENAVSVLLDKHKVKVDAVLAADDSIAVGAIKSLNKRGIKVPGDIAVAGFDNLDKASYIFPCLTTVSQQFILQGTNAVYTLLKQIEKDEVEDNITLPARLIIRNSCGCENPYDLFENHDIDGLIKERNKKTFSFLVEKLIDTVNEGSHDMFLFYLEKELIEDFSRSKSLIYWQKLLDEIFNQIRDDYKYIPPRFLSLLYKKSREKLFHFLLRENQEKNNQNEEDGNKLQLLSQRLLAAFDLNQLFRILEQSISSLRINHCFLVLYKPDDSEFIPDSQWESPESVELVLAVKDKESVMDAAQSITFSSDTLLPDGLLNSGERNDFVFLPITFNKNEHYGYILLDYNADISVNIYNALINIIGSAIHGCLLIKQLELTVNQKTSCFINIVHEMKTPLTIVSSYLEKYLRSSDDINDLCIVQQNVNKLITDMKNVMDNEKLDKEMCFYSDNEIINVSEILQEKALDFKEISIKEGIRISVSCPDNLYVNIDPFGMERILNNLFDNAIRYNKKGGRVNVSVKACNGILNLQVSNTGKIIAKKHYKTVFEPFRQVSCKKRNTQGIGMGLSIVRKIVEFAGGSIRLLENIGETTFELSIPLVCSDKLKKSCSGLKKKTRPAEIINTEITGNEYDEKKDTILIIEDNNQMLSFLVQSMSSLYNTYWAENGGDALNLLTQIPKPDIILSDIIMDGMDGFEFIKCLKHDSCYKSIPLLFITAKDNPADKLMGLELGAFDYIQKPFVIEEVKMKLYSLMEYTNMLKDNSQKELDKFIHNYIVTEGKQDEDISITSLSNKFHLTGKEREIVNYLKTGKLYKEIAFIMDLSVNTIKSHVYRIYKKCDVTNRMELFTISENR